MTDIKIENRSFWENEEKKLDERVYQAMWPGGEKTVERLIKQGKQPVRELVSKLIDPETEFYELGGIAGFGMDYPGVMDVPCCGFVMRLG